MIDNTASHLIALAHCVGAIFIITIEETYGKAIFFLRIDLRITTISWTLAYRIYDLSPTNQEVHMNPIFDARFRDYKKIVEVYRHYKSECATIESITRFAHEKGIDISDDEVEIIVNMLTLYRGTDE